MMMTTGSHKRSLAILAATAAALALVEPRPAAGCTMDVECKGVRICENGNCVYPLGSDAAPVPPAAAVAAPAAATPAPVTSGQIVMRPLPTRPMPFSFAG